MSLVAVASGLALLGAGPAWGAVTRYAAPGGTAADTVCVTPTAAPCSIATAAAGPNVVATDEAIIASGEYSDTAGDLGVDGWVQITGGVNVHGVAGQLRPVIRQDSNPTIGALILPSGSATTRLAHVEIRTDASRSALGVDGGIAEDLIVLSSAGVAQGIVCLHHGGTIRNSVCLSSGNEQAALGGSVSTAPQNTTLNVRNVTAVATGTGSFGIDYFFGGAGANFTISAKGVIAQGTSVDARARATTGATTTVNLDHSNFDTVSSSSAMGGVGTITPAVAGAPNFNQLVPAVLAADGYHQLAGSSTIDTGQTDGLSGTQDIDGQNRQIGLAADIGADEMGIGSSTTVACTPSPALVGTPSMCTATVTAPAEFINGTVSFTSDAGGAFGGGGSCTLPSSMTSSQCQLTYTPGQSGVHQIAASYSGDANHEGSQGSTSLSASVPAAPPASTPRPGATPVKCKKKKGKKGAVAAKKCKKKKKK